MLVFNGKVDLEPIVIHPQVRFMPSRAFATEAADENVMEFVEVLGSKASPGGT